MPIDFSNTNSLWASVIAETLRRLGLNLSVICPGSRSTPLAIAFSQQSTQELVEQTYEAISVLDERSAAFFALGLSRQSGLPTALICTSGTAAANFYPAVIEAKESQVPLLILTADRPPELRHCNAGQAIDQQKLFGSYPNWYAELAVPSTERSQLNYLRQTLIHAWEKALWPVPGPVHLNLPFREPLAPLPDPTVLSLSRSFQTQEFFAGVTRLTHLPPPTAYAPIPLQEWKQCGQGLIIAGPTQPRFPAQYCAAVAQLSKFLGWPVLAEGLSPLRNHADLNPYLISTYDLILRNGELASQLQPEMVIRLGETPTSKVLRTWLEAIQPRQWIVDASGRNLDPLHSRTTHLRLSVEQFTQILPMELRSQQVPPPFPKFGLEKPIAAMGYSYLAFWCAVEAEVRRNLDQTFNGLETLFEGKAAWLLSKVLPPQTPLFISNSMPVRDVEFFWAPGKMAIQPFFNRGANGIDGCLSTALGIAHRQHQSSVMLTGDLALLYDTNGFLLSKKFAGHLTIVLINNNGGGIFETLPIAQFEPPFEEFFATPQNIDFAQLCATYNVEYERIVQWDQLRQRLNPLPEKGIRVLELRTDRKADAQWRHEKLKEFAANLDF